MSYDPERCEAAVHSGGTWSGSHQCANRWAATRDDERPDSRTGEPRSETRRVCGIHARARGVWYINRPRPLYVGTVEVRVISRRSVSDVEELGRQAERLRELAQRHLVYVSGDLVQIEQKLGERVLNERELAEAAEGRRMPPREPVPDPEAAPRAS